MIEVVDITSKVTIALSADSAVTQLFAGESMVTLTHSDGSMITMIYPVTSKTGLESA